MKRHKGSIIVFALIVLSFILIAAFSVAAVTLLERKSANISVNSSTAFQNSDKGMEEFLQQIYKDLDQNDTLADLADALNAIYNTSDYECHDGNAVTGVPARIGSDGANVGENETEFIISAYREDSVLYTGSSGWENNELIPLDNCSDQLADVARFKVAGNYNNASRAVFVKLRDSLTRGLVARWSFEDRAQIARFLVNAGEQNQRKSFIAHDSSKQRHVLTLCPLREEASNLPIEVDIDIGNGDTITYEIDEFGDCGSDPTTGDAGGMSPYRRDEDDSHDDSNGDDEWENEGAWVTGIVEEGIGGDDAVTGAGDAHNEAIYVNGHTFLAMHTSNSCGDDVINCVDSDSEDDLQEIDDSMSVSLWIKADNESAADQYLLSRRDDSNSLYQLRLDDQKIHFAVGNGGEASTGNVITDNDWHHIVGVWGTNVSNHYLKVFVDGDEAVSRNAVSGMTAPKDTLYLGTEDGTGNYFTGAIDDVHIWDRSLTEREVCRLCKEAFDQDNPPSDAPTCDCTL